VLNETDSKFLVNISPETDSETFDVTMCRREKTRRGDSRVVNSYTIH